MAEEYDDTYYAPQISQMGETRQLVIPCNRCGESRVILAKQG